MKRLVQFALLGSTVGAFELPALAQSSSAPSLGTYAAAPPGSVNTHWIETPTGVIVIDAQRVTSEALKAVDKIRQLRKPVLAILITHAHPDHFGGLPTFINAFGPAVPIYASPRAIRAMRADEGNFIKLTKQNYRDDFNDKVTLPSHTLQPKQTLQIGGIEIQAVELGEGEASAMTVYYLPATNTLYSGDVVDNARTPFLLEGRSGAWLSQLSVLERIFPNVADIRPGHGDTAGRELIWEQREYLTRIRRLVAERLTGDGRLSAIEKATAAQALNTRYPGFSGVSAIDNLMGLNLDAVAKEMASKAKRSANR